MRWPDDGYQPTSIRELTTREAPLPERTISDVNSREWMEGFVQGVALGLCVAFLLGAAVLLIAAYR